MVDIDKVVVAVVMCVILLGIAYVAVGGEVGPSIIDAGTSTKMEIQNAFN